jgi:hypothetical protein
MRPLPSAGVRTRDDPTATFRARPRSSVPVLPGCCQRSCQTAARLFPGQVSEVLMAIMPRALRGIQLFPVPDLVAI